VSSSPESRDIIKDHKETGASEGHWGQDGAEQSARK